MSAEFTPAHKATELGEPVNVDAMTAEQQFAFYDESTNGYWSEQGYTPESLAAYFAGFETENESAATPEKINEAESLRARVFDIAMYGADLATIREVAGDIWDAVRRKAIPVAVALGLATTLAACGPSEPAPGTVAPGEVVDTPAPIETDTAPERFEGFDFEREDPLPADLEALDAMSPGEFAAQPKSEQLRWASWVAQYMPEFVSTYHSSVSGDASDAPYTLTPDSDIFTQLVHSDYVERLGATLSDGPLPEEPRYNGPLNRDMIQKYIMAHTSSEPESAWRVNQYMDAVGNDGQALNISLVANLYESRQDAEDAPDFRTAPEIVYIDGQSYNGTRVIYSTPEGGNANLTIVVVPFKNYLGETAYDTVVGD
jgi:hypothetical protein